MIEKGAECIFQFEEQELQAEGRLTIGPRISNLPHKVGRLPTAERLFQALCDCQSDILAEWVRDNLHADRQPTICFAATHYGRRPPSDIVSDRVAEAAEVLIIGRCAVRQGRLRVDRAENRVVVAEEGRHFGAVAVQGGPVMCEPRNIGAIALELI